MSIQPVVVSFAVVNVLACCYAVCCYLSIYICVFQCKPVIVMSPFSVIPSGLSNVGYADIQASTITCTDLLDTDFTNTDIPTTKTTSFTDGSSYQVCARATDIHDNPVYSSFAFTIDITEPSTPTVDTPADKAVSGLSISSDGITEKGDITITGCALENTDVYAQITADSITTQASTFTTANDTTRLY